MTGSGSGEGGSSSGRSQRPREERAHHAAGALGLEARRRGEVDVAEHEGAQPQEGGADVRGLADLVGVPARLDHVGDERRQAARGGVAQRGDLVGGQVGAREHAGPEGVLDVVVDVRHPVHQAHDLALEGGRAPRARVVEDAVAHLAGEVEAPPVALEHVDDPEALDVVLEAPPVALAQDLVERGLARVAEGGVPEVVPHRDRLDQVLVQLERPRHGARERRHLEGVGEPGAVVVARRRDEDLGLVLQPAEGGGVEDAVAVALEGGPQRVGLLRALADRALGARGAGAEGRLRGRRRRQGPWPSGIGKTHGPGTLRSDLALVAHRADRDRQRRDGLGDRRGEGEGPLQPVALGARSRRTPPGSSRAESSTAITSSTLIAATGARRRRRGT